MATVTLKLDKDQLDLLDKLYHEYYQNGPLPPYVTAIYRPNDCVITVYSSQKAVFQGNEADYHAAVFQPSKDLYQHAGSDEVGTGDYFGPVCVCACIVNHTHQELLNQLEIRDSKALTDAKIMIIAPQLIKNLPHSLLILHNRKYNQIQTFNNMNEIKAKMHNQAYLNLRKKVPLPKKIIIDQFTPEKNYYRYLASEPQVISGISFETKAEDKYPAVGCASIIARYAFLKAFKNMNEHYDWVFPKGAGDKVDTNARKFIERFGSEELKNVAKLNFKNTDRIKE
ncbi:MAG: ribonuclease HIII [Erysipelotrichaceae bacterium]|nr:ribonuclease HIII [Erysipelotrichaceae bacterium]